MAKQKFNFSKGMANSFAETSKVSANESKPEESLTAPVQTKSEGRYEIKMLPLHKLRFNKDNDYQQTNIESLASSILKVGLLHNLVVEYDLESDMYTIDSGERRTRAIKMLIDKFEADGNDEDSEDYGYYLKNVKPFITVGIPCNIKRKHSDNNDILSRVRILAANEEVRQQTPAERMKKVEELSELYKKLGSSKNTGIKNINKQIADDLNISPRQVAKYKAAATLIPELKKEFEEAHINLNEASGYASLSSEEQRMLYEFIISGKKASANEVRQIKEELEKAKKLNDETASEDRAKLEAKTQELEDIKRKKEKEIETLKQQLADEASSHETEIESLRQQLNDETASENRTELEAKTQELEDIKRKKEKEIEALKQQLANEASSHEAEIESLKQQLEVNIPKPVQIEIPVEPEDILSRVRYEESYKALKKSIDTFLDAAANYDAADPNIINALKNIKVER